MRPRKDDEAFVDLIDVLLRDGVVLRADVIVSIAEIPLVGLKLTAVLAGMETMNEYGLFEEWDARQRRRAISRRQHGGADDDERGELPDRLAIGHRDGGDDVAAADADDDRENGASDGEQ